MAEPGSLDQVRAAYAWQKVGATPSKDYVNLAKGAPALVMSNGLMQTLAFYRSKGRQHHNDLLNHVIGWLGKLFPKEIEPTASFETSMDFLQKGDSATYMHATEEVLEVLRWIRQFAAARFKEPKTASEG